jgi:hypothetical protein
MWAISGNEQHLADFVLIGSVFGSPWADAGTTPRMLAALVVLGVVSALFCRFRWAGWLWAAATLVAWPLWCPVTVRSAIPVDDHLVLANIPELLHRTLSHPGDVPGVRPRGARGRDRARPDHETQRPGRERRRDRHRVRGGGASLRSGPAHVDTAARVRVLPRWPPSRRPGLSARHRAQGDGCRVLSLRLSEAEHDRHGDVPGGPADHGLRRLLSGCQLLSR